MEEECERFMCDKCKKNRANPIRCSHMICTECMFCFACPICNKDIFYGCNFFDTSFGIKNGRLYAKIYSELDMVFFSDITSDEMSVECRHSSNSFVFTDLNNFKERKMRYICLRKIIRCSLGNIFLTSCSKTFVDIYSNSLFEIDQYDMQISFIRYLDVKN